MTTPRLRNTLAAALLAATALGGGVLGSTLAAPSPAYAAPLAAVAAQPQGFADLVDRVAPAVVKIAVAGTAPSEQAQAIPPGFLPPGAKLRGAEPRRVMGEGSGFIIDPSGLVVTNFHVAGHADSIRVTLADGTTLPARVIGSDERTDLALLQVATDKPLPAVSFADGAEPRVGDWVLAVGNPFGLGPSVTAGIISARGRDLNAGPYDSFLQTDAPINPGNSGGPLFDTQGRVVGVNTAILSPSGANAGIGFAVPADLASRVVTALKADGRVARGWLGVETAPFAEGKREGAMVAAVQDNGPAAKAGLRPGDVITAVDGQAVKDPRALARLVADQHPGAEVALTIARGPASTTLRATLKDQPPLHAQS
ncbi:trypsin-like peptidase domain-containing protein [Roseomonas sp. OT10]|uniref:trypsin-like peptidase domain-containing protein n=1 Tax=Roseomonas cutis TaxID=2897332 RepID=UPI001E2E536E|nr:trypsin-like peptidase domain-containing protein [Roseomonas sp. OT10]UFN49465.1 trypsin-like peptidase domain-containing protein [Roseomonas sp. OT10]